MRDNSDFLVRDGGGHKLSRQIAATLAGDLAQADILKSRSSGEDEVLCEIIGAGLVDMQAREAPSLPATGDADLAAEREIAKLTERETRLVCDVFDEDRCVAEALINETAPQTLVGAAVKLRAILSLCDQQNRRPDNDYGTHLRVPVDRDHRFRWEMITQSGAT